MPKYLLLKHYRGGPEPHHPVPPMDQRAPTWRRAWPFVVQRLAPTTGNPIGWPKALGLASQAMSFVVEPERLDDVAAISDVVRRAFHHHQSVADLVELIRGSPQYIPELALVARIGPQVVGFVMLSRAEIVDTDSARHDVLTLSPLAVAPNYERRGIGSALVRAGLTAAEATGTGLVTLEGSPTYYGRLGFRFAPDFGITIDLPEWAPREAAQVYLLQSYDSTVRGRLEYPPAFSAID